MKKQLPWDTSCWRMHRISLDTTQMLTDTAHSSGAWCWDAACGSQERTWAGPLLDHGTGCLCRSSACCGEWPELSYTVGGDIELQPLLKQFWLFLIKLDIYVFCDSAIPPTRHLTKSTEGICSQRDLYRTIYSSLFIISKSGHHPGVHHQMWCSRTRWYC